MSLVSNPKYPVENGQGPRRFKRWYVDDINGTMHPEDEVVRDTQGRLRYIHDLGEPDADDLREAWQIPAEQSPEDP